MKKTLSFLLAAALGFGLCACGSTASSSEETPSALVEDSSYVLQLPEGADPLDGGGALIAYAAGPGGVEAGEDAAAWRGVQTFAETFHYTAQSYTAEGPGREAALAALRAAAESGASMVVCRGETMAEALYSLQGNYPTVSYLLLGAEPHSEDYATYTTNANVHCILYQEEQAGYLAGYAAVMEGYTSLGFLGAEKMPGVVRYCTGFLQGVEAAAERQGEEAALKIWYGGSYDASEEITARMAGWYQEGTQLVLACGGTLAQSCVDAARENGGKVIAAGWDQASLGDQVLTSAIECDSATVQQSLYSFYAGGGAWDASLAGQTESLGYSTGSLALPTGDWRFSRFTISDYAELYGRLREGTLRVERYSDADDLPPVSNVAIYSQN